MAQAPIRKPEVATAGGLPWVQVRQLVTESSSGAFKSQQFVTLSSGNATKCTDGASAGACHGLSQRDAAGTAAEAYLTPTANQHNAVDPSNRFIVNVMTSTKAVGTGATSSVTVGSTYGLGSFTTTGYTDVQGLNISDTASSSAFFKVERIRSDLDATSDTNGRVEVSIVASRI